MNLETVTIDTMPHRPLGPTQRKVLDELRRRQKLGHNGIFARSIATATRLSVDQVSAALDRLHRRNLVRREITAERIGLQHYKVNLWWLP